MNSDSRRPRVLLVSSVVPALDRGGGCLALHRHFCERDDFEVAVASELARGSTCPVRIELDTNRLVGRLRRYSRFLGNLKYVLPRPGVQRAVNRFAETWKPDLVFSVADDTHSLTGLHLARQRGVPFVVYFQDLFAFSTFIPRTQRPYAWVGRRLVQRYRHLQRVSDAVFHTCSGMKDWFGEEAKGEILYAVGGEASQRSEREGGQSPEARKIRLVYAGNCYGAYGRMILELARALEGSSNLDLQVYAMGNDWPAKDVEYFARRGVYLGYLPFGQLQERLLGADAFLITMGFEERDRTFVQTSFPTKWCDYAPFGRPIFVWAPGYSSSARFARETSGGVLVAEPSAHKLVEAIGQVFGNPGRVGEMSRAARGLADHELNSHRLHGVLKNRLLSLCQGGVGPRGGES
ncbi:MAG: hypothetical protein U1F61_18465 [Opitutaceae bacterium]